jgi:O-antigen/teichoic acid export membrane protein
MASLVVSRLFVAGAGFLASVAMANAFSKETYGRYQLINAATTVVATFCLTGLSDAALISAAKSKDGNLAAVIRQRLSAGALGAVAIVVWGFARYRDDPAMLLAFVVAGALFAPIQLQSIWQAFTNGKRRFRLLTLGQVALAAANLAGVAAFVAVGATSDDMLPYVVLASQGLIAAVGLLLQLQIHRMKQNDDVDASIVRYGHHVTVASLLSWVFASDRLILGEVLTAADVAVLSVAIVLPAQVKIFFTAFEQVFLPRVTAAPSVAGAWQYMKRHMTKLWATYTLLGIVGFVLLPIVIPLFFSHRYVEAVPFAKWLWLSTCLSSPRSATSASSTSRTSRIPR